MRRIKPLALTFAALILAFSGFAQAQETPKVLRIVDFGGLGLAQNESAALQDLVTSYIIELKTFRVTDSSGQELALKEAETAVQLGQSKDVQPLVADYILSAEAEKVGSLLVFKMDVTKASTGEKRSVADSFSSVNDLILASRRLTLTLFNRQDDASQAAPAAAPTPGGSGVPASETVMTGAPSLALIAGTWRGDKNIDRVTLFLDGQGFAILDSGQRMALKATVQGSAVIVEQNQANSPDFYRPSLDLRSARIVAAGARPWRWVFALSADSKSLIGMKESVFVKVTEEGQVSLDNSYVRAAQWTRLYH
jgi:hypothetical protein